MKDKLIRLGIFLVCMFCVYQFGLKPMIKKDTSIKTTSGNFGWAKKDLIRESDKYDVIVFGEEPEGIAAAVTAARAGAKTLLVATGNDLGGSICGSLDFNFEPDIGINNEVLNRGIFTEIISALGNEISPQKYKSVMEKLVKSVNNLEVIYGASLKSPAVDNNIIYGINLVVDGKEGSYFGKRFIDASKYGELLVKCKAPCFKGAEDINLKNVYAPVSINFEISNIKWSEVEDSLSQDKIERLKGALSAYKPVNANFRLGKIKFINEGDGKIIVHGLEAFNVNVADDKALMDQYYIATEEAKTFAKFLKDRLIPFQNSVYEKTADKFSIKEYRHFKGEHILTVNEALQNTDFIDKVAVASNPIEAYSSDDTNEKYIIGKPLQYSIPLGCIIPLEIDNLFMIGSKISYSSLVSSSSASIGSNITVGESSGIAAVYSLVKNELPRTFVKGIGSKKVSGFNELLKKEGVYLPDTEVKNPNVDNWSYTSVKQLNSLGLISAGANNDYKFDKEATQKDLAALILNGICRLAPEKYSLKLDKRIRPYFTEDGLTIDRAAVILLELNGEAANNKEAYSKACEKGYIDNEMQLRLKDQKIMTMDQVFELSAYNIKLFTGKTFPE